MLRKLIVLACCTLFCLVGMAQNKITGKKAATWGDAVVNLKREIRNGKSAGPVPVFSGVMRHKMPAQAISMDVTGIDELLLSTWGTADGNDWDHAEWANARFTTTDGKTVWLDELKWKYAKAPYDCPILNRHFSGSKMTIAGKEYDRGVLLHADGEMIYSLGKKYTRFEAEIGIDDKATSISSVIFRVQDASGKSLTDQLAPQFREDARQFALEARISPDLWLATPDASVEKSRVENLIKKFPDASYFKEIMKQLDAKSVDEQIAGYIELSKIAARVNRVAEGLEWMNTTALRLAFDNMKKNASFDAAKYEPKVKEIEANAASVAKAIYKGEPAVLAQAESLLQAHREILLANPL